MSHSGLRESCAQIRFPQNVTLIDVYSCSMQILLNSDKCLSPPTGSIRFVPLRHVGRIKATDFPRTKASSRPPTPPLTIHPRLFSLSHLPASEFPINPILSPFNTPRVTASYLSLADAPFWAMRTSSRPPPGWICSPTTSGAPTWATLAHTALTGQCARSATSSTTGWAASNPMDTT